MTRGKKGAGAPPRNSAVSRPRESGGPVFFDSLDELAEEHDPLGLLEAERAVHRMARTFASAVSEASSLHPQSRVHLPTSATSARAIPRRRASGTTYKPSRKPTGEDCAPVT